MDWNATTVWINLRPIFWNLVRTPPEKRDLALVTDSRNKLAANMAILDAHLASRKYVIGEVFSMGDIPLGTAVQRWFNLPIERKNFRNLEAYYRRLQERAPFKQWVDLLPLT